MDGSCIGCGIDDQSIVDQVRHAFNLTYSKITDPKLLACLRRRCDEDGIIVCHLIEESRLCEEGDLGWAVPKVLVEVSQTANLCVNTFDGAWYQSVMGIGMVVIHEWAHTCGWHHNRPGNVPGNGGSQGMGEGSWPDP